MSFAVSTASGYTCQFGSHAKPVQAGFAARAGVEAACLARAGLSGQPHVLDHPRGTAALMGGLDHDRLGDALGKLGQGYALGEHGLVLKPWPSCGYTHRIMTCALDLRQQAAPDQIAHIDVHLPDFHAAVLPFGQPASRAEALFSLPFVTAMGLLRGQLTLADLDAQTWEDPDISRLAAKVRVHAFAPRRPNENYSKDDPDRLVLTLTDGRKMEATCVYPLGAPQAPMSSQQLWDKFNANTGARSGADSGRRAWADKLHNWPAQTSVQALLTREGPII